MPSFSTTLEKAIHKSLALAAARKHELATLEHLLLALIEEPEASSVRNSCSRQPRTQTARMQMVNPQGTSP